MTLWTDFVRDWGKLNNISYFKALSKPECSAEYRKKYPKTKKSNYIVQSVIFSKDKWTVPSAKSWLKKNDYKALKVDKKEEHLRFRQVEPDIGESEGFTEYRTKQLKDSGISLILAYKKRGLKEKDAANIVL